MEIPRTFQGGEWGVVWRWEEGLVENLRCHPLHEISSDFYHICASSEPTRTWEQRRSRRYNKSVSSPQHSSQTTHECFSHLTRKHPSTRPPPPRPSLSCGPCCCAPHWAECSSASYMNREPSHLSAVLHTIWDDRLSGLATLWAC